jgi:hypothetical protein
MKNPNPIAVTRLTCCHLLFLRNVSSFHDFMHGPARWMITFILICISSRIVAQMSGPLSGPEPKSFSSASDNLGFLENSVNLFSGTSQFAIPVSSLPFGNADYTLNLNYQSTNVKRQATTWNREAATGAFGLGWNLDVPRIVVDTRETATRVDDEFYIIHGGVSMLLIYKELQGSSWVFYTKNYQFWKILYDPVLEKWTITREDGSTHVFGDPANGRNAIQYMARWGNWIGNSKASGASRLVYIWDLSEISNLLGQRLYFTYLHESENIANTTHTRASYLKKIANSSGESVELDYQAKAPSEYEDPHLEAAEPDAYQEKYSTKYVAQVTHYNESSVNVGELRFSYSFLGSGNVQKRLLRSVTQVMPDGASRTKFQFGYEERPDGAQNYNLGALNRVTTATGGSIEYTYSNLTLTATQQELQIAEVTNYAEPRVWVGDDYVVVTRRYLPSGVHNDGAQPVRVDVYTWENGKWIAKNLPGLTDVSLKVDNGVRSQNYDFVMGKDFFAFLNRRAGSDRYDLSMYRKSERLPGEWERTYKEFWRTANTTKAPYTELGDDPKLMAGRDYVMIAADYQAFADDKHFIYQWNGAAWQFSYEAKPGNRFYYAAGPDYYIVHEDATSGFDKIKFYTLNRDGTWTTRSVSSSESFTSSGKSYWHASANCAVVMAVDNNEFIYTWDENFSNIKKFNTGIGIDDKSFVAFYGGNTILMVIPSESGGGYAFHYNGSTWVSSGFIQYWGVPAGLINLISQGEDFVYHPNSYPPPGGNGFYTFKGLVRRFNPNTGAWLGDLELAKYYNGLNSTAGFSFLLCEGQLSFRKPDGTFTAPVSTFMNNYNQLVEPAAAGLDFVTSTQLGSAKFRVGVTMIRNGQKHSEVTLSSQIGGADVNERNYFVLVPNTHVPSMLTGPSTIVTFLNSPAYLQDARVLKLYRKVGEKVTGDLSQYVLSRLTINDGVTSRHTSFKYDVNMATADVTGFVPQFNKVEVYPGVADPAVTPYPAGYKKIFFVNGPSSSETTANDPDGTFGGDMGIYLKKFLGTTYRVVYIDPTIAAADKSVIKQDIYFSHYPKENGFFLRHLYTRTKDMQALRHRVNEFVYSNVYGHVISDVNYVLNSSNVRTDETTVTYKYWWEVYDPTRAMNNFTDVAQTTAYKGTNVLSVKAVRWKTYAVNSTNVSLPADEYTWKRTGSSTFTAWDPATTPSSDWELAGKVVTRDGVNGVPLEQQNGGGEVSSQIFDFKRRNVVANVSNAVLSNIAHTSFEDAAAGNFTYIDGTVATGDARTGDRYMILGLGGIARTVATTETYTVSFWAKSSGGSVEVDGLGIIPVPGSGWQPITGTVTGVNGIRIRRSGTVEVQIDEVRIHPSSAFMSTATFHPIYGVTSSTDPNLRTFYTQYDSFGRVTFQLDEKKNIIKSFTYNIKK